MGFLRNTFRAWRADTSGQFAIVTAAVSIPLLMGVGYAIDHARIVKYESNLSSAVDAAALAAVMPSLLSESERKAYAEEVFYQNFTDDVPIQLDIDASPEQVDVKAEGELPTLFASVLGSEFSMVREDASAVVTREYIVCALALDPSGIKTLEFADNARFNAPACAVQANSTHENALWSKSSTAPLAKSFCSTGGAQGSFYPHVKTNCTPIEDPYKDLVVPDPADSCDQRENVTIRGNNWDEYDDDDPYAGVTMQRFAESELARTETGESIIPANAVLEPGIYCRGLQIDGANVRLNPGVYHIWGDLVFTHRANVMGDGVTFLLKGDDNRLLIENGASVWLRAPASGLTAGLVFWQAHLDFKKYIKGKKTPKPPGQTATSEINSGGGLHIVGTAYFPNHELLITSDNSVASRAPATSFIAYRLKFAGSANMQINVDHQAGGIPPIQPRSDDGARLLR